MFFDETRSFDKTDYAYRIDPTVIVHKRRTTCGTELFTSNVAFKKEKKDPNTSTMYFMVFGTTSLSVINNVFRYNKFVRYQQC